MLFDLEYLGLAIFVLGMNIMPGFMPPTWAVLTFFYVHFQLNLVPIIIIGAMSATLGRVILANIARLYFRRLFPKKFTQNYEDLGLYFAKNQKMTIPIVLMYAFLPIPSNQVFIIAGLAELNLKIIAFSFFIGRLVSYTFWVTVATQVTNRFENLFVDHFSSKETIVAEAFGLLLIIAIGKINWKKILKI